MTTFAPELADAELELEDLARELAAARTRCLDLLEAVRVVRARQQDSGAPAPPPSPPRPGSTAEHPPGPAAEPSAAAAPALPSSPTGGEAPALSPRAQRRLDAVLGAMRRLGPGWHGTGNVAGEAGINAQTATRGLRDGAALGALEHNGKGGAYSRFRLASRAPVEAPPLRPVLLEQDATRPPSTSARDASRATGAAGRVPQDLGNASPLEPGRISPRVRRELDREARIKATAFADRDDGTGTLPGRILEALQAQPAGVRGLARRLGDNDGKPWPDLVTTLAHMLGTADLVRHVNPDRTLGAETHLYYPAR